MYPHVIDITGICCAVLIFLLFAGDLSRDLPFVLHVTLCLLRLSDESQLLSC